MGPLPWLATLCRTSFFHSPDALDRLDLASRAGPVVRRLHCGLSAGRNRRITSGMPWASVGKPLVVYNAQAISTACLPLAEYSFWAVQPRPSP